MKNQNAEQLVSFARQVAADTTVWADWHNQVFGADGKFMELFPTQEERAEFVDSAYYPQIEELSQALRNGVSIQDYTTPTASGRFVVRIPKSLHAALTEEAKKEGVSLNQLVVAKLAVNLQAAARQIVEGSGQICCNN